MLIEALILGGDEGALHEWRHIGDLDERPPLESELGEKAPVGREEFRRLSRLVVLKRVGGRTPPGATDHRPTGVAKAGASGAEEADGEEQDACETRILLAESSTEWKCG